MHRAKRFAMGWMEIYAAAPGYQHIVEGRRIRRRRKPAPNARKMRANRTQDACAPMEAAWVST
jgi:hypothetical protein